MPSDVVVQYVQGLDIHQCTREFLAAMREHHKQDIAEDSYGALVPATGIDEDRLRLLLSAGNAEAEKPEICGYEITALMNTQEEFNLKRMFGVPEALDEDAVVNEEFLKFYQGRDKASAAAKTAGNKRRMLYQHCYDLCLQRYPFSPGETAS